MLLLPPGERNGDKIPMATPHTRQMAMSLTCYCNFLRMHSTIAQKYLEKILIEMTTDVIGGRGHVFFLLRVGGGGR